MCLRFSQAHCWDHLTSLHVFIYNLLMLQLLLHRGIRATAKYDLMRGIIFVICCYALSHLDISMAYHYIRGQALLKLYVIYNLLEV